MKSKNIVLKKTTANDTSFIYKWINNPFVRKYSFNKKKISKGINKLFWNKNLNSKKHLSYTMFFKEKKYKPCGFFSANLYQEYCLINYLIAPKFRKMGLSKFLLKLGLKKINNYKRDIKIFAKVKKNNIRSIISLHSAKFVIYQEKKNYIKMIFKK